MDKPKVLWGARFFSGVLCLLSPAAASAHINLLSPPPRHPGDQENKACPCGVGASDRFCNLEGERSDSARSSQVTTLVAGSTVVFRFDEYIGHAGRYRVAFDLEGADQADFDAQILVDIPDPPGGEGNVGEGSIWEIEVPVPNVPCDQCTLQLVQMMDGNTEDPVPSPIDRSSYYQCADIVIVSAAEAGADAGAVAAPDGGAQAGGDAGATGAGSGDADGSVLGSPDGGVAAPVGAGSGQSGDAASAQGDTGCSLATGSERAWSWACLGLLLWARSRQRGAAGRPCRRA